MKRIIGTSITCTTVARLNDLLAVGNRRELISGRSLTVAVCLKNYVVYI